MMRVLLNIFIVATSYCRYVPLQNSSLFRKEHIIFSSNFNITRLLVPADGNKYSEHDSSDIPTIFFAISDPKLEGGSCIYVLEDFAAYEVLEGGRDATADYSSERTIFFGAKDGIYKYTPETLSATRYGPFRDDILQLQKANGSDAIYVLNSDHRIYKIERNGTVRNRIQAITCALEFVLDTSNNIYYISCGDRLPYIVKSDSNLPTLTPCILEDFRTVKLLRPAFIMESSIPFFGDGQLYILHSNGSSAKKEFYLEERPTAFSVDAALYLIAALDGKIYDFNLMDALLRSMFGLPNEWPKGVTRLVMAIFDAAKERIYGYYKGWSSVTNLV